MLGRSLIFLCALTALTALAIQSCAAPTTSPVQDGVYRILNRHRGLLTSPGSAKGAPVFLLSQDKATDSQLWEVRNEDGLVLIRNLKTDYYLAPGNPKSIRIRELIVQSGEEFSWLVSYNDNKNVYHISPPNFLESGLTLGVSPLAIFPSHVDFGFWRPDREQQWDFVFVGKAQKQQPRTQCGPWRIPRHESYLEQAFSHRCSSK
jgi:hypothetical protein